jgi:hypothetical protein
MDTSADQHKTLKRDFGEMKSDDTTTMTVNPFVCASLNGDSERVTMTDSLTNIEPVPVEMDQPCEHQRIPTFLDKIVARRRDCERVAKRDLELCKQKLSATASNAIEFAFANLKSTLLNALPPLPNQIKVNVPFVQTLHDFPLTEAESFMTEFVTSVVDDFQKGTMLSPNGVDNVHDDKDHTIAIGHDYRKKTWGDQQETNITITFWFSDSQLYIPCKILVSHTGILVPKDDPPESGDSDYE